MELRYTIKRECWNEKTYNGYSDNPYWLIEFDGYKIGLKDDGKFWSIINGVNVNGQNIKDSLKQICQECKLDNLQGDR